MGCQPDQTILFLLVAVLRQHHHLDPNVTLDTVNKHRYNTVILTLPRLAGDLGAAGAFLEAARDLFGASSSSLPRVVWKCINAFLIACINSPLDTRFKAEAIHTYRPSFALRKHGL